MTVGKVTFTKAEREKLAEVLWLLNGVSVLTGALLLGLGVFLKVELQRWQEVMSEQGLLYVPHMLISTGLAACCINFLGGKICLDCTDTNRFLRWKLVMMPYIICTLFFTCCVLVGALMCYSMRSQLEASLSLGLRNAMVHYKDTDTPGRCYLKRTLDMLQIQLECCGNTGYRDWFQVQWISKRYLDMSSSLVLGLFEGTSQSSRGFLEPVSPPMGLRGPPSSPPPYWDSAAVLCPHSRLRSNVGGRYLVDQVPFSCCSTFSPRPCIQQQVSDASAHFNYDRLSQRLNLWTRGCREALMEHYTGIGTSIGLTVLLIWMFEVLQVEASHTHQSPAGPATIIFCVFCPSAAGSDRSSLPPDGHGERPQAGGPGLGIGRLDSGGQLGRNGSVQPKYHQEPGKVLPSGR
ncbi:unnamed protein product [Tetraodon nigroviridis]|uniref:(spotted green pufferfish) hypothetical protein n=1 Tax=Tetraodon nigroviridis TaxID=99883 RepID=Q4T2B0_TETNG|nr:unnamed protein product [Tetraodon nigroviridis]